jgi:hypothetical protein
MPPIIPLSTLVCKWFEKFAPCAQYVDYSCLFLAYILATDFSLKNMLSPRGWSLMDTYQLPKFQRKLSRILKPLATIRGMDRASLFN